MPRLIRLLLILVVSLSSLDSARAEGLVQLTLQGSLQMRGGAPVEVRWAVHAGNGTVKEATLHLHLAKHTTAHDLATLIVSRLRKRGAKVLFPAEGVPQKGDVQIFVEDTTLLSLRLAPGMSSIVTTCEGAPLRVRFLKPLAAARNANMVIRTSTFHAHTKLPGSILLELELDAMRPTAMISDALFEQSLAKGLVGDRPSADSWRPVKATDGASVTGCSIEFSSQDSDWGLEVQLDVPRPQ